MKLSKDQSNYQRSFKGSCLRRRWKTWRIWWWKWLRSQRRPWRSRRSIYSSSEQTQNWHVKPIRISQSKSLSWLPQHYKHYETQTSWFLRCLWYQIHRFNVNSWEHNWKNHASHHSIFLYGNWTLIFKVNENWRIWEFIRCWVLAWKSFGIISKVFTWRCTACETYC